jgi:type IV secretory pathway VirB10-like protein
MFDVLPTEGVLAVPATTAERPQLGEVLIERRLLTEEQLEVGLAQNRWSGRPLSEVLIALGFVTETTIAQALATQHGGLIKTEYGFATGFSAQAAAEAEVEAPPPVSVAAQPEPEPVAVALPRLEVVPPLAPPAPVEALAPAVAAPTPVEAFEERAKAAAAEGRVLELEEELRSANRRADAAEARVSALEADFGSANVRHESLELELAGARQAEADLLTAGAQQARELAEATQTLQAAFARLQYLEALFQQQPAQPERQPAPATAQTRSPYAWQD